MPPDAADAWMLDVKLRRADRLTMPAIKLTDAELAAVFNAARKARCWFRELAID
jgi:hypothetical protein